MSRSDQLVSVAQAEDTYDLLNHIAWTDVIKPQLDAQHRRYTDLLVSSALGTPLPGTLTREQVAGMCYGINYVSNLFDQILRKGKDALKDLNALGVSPSRT